MANAGGPSFKSRTGVMPKRKHLWDHLQGEEWGLGWKMRFSKVFQRSL